MRSNYDEDSKVKLYIIIICVAFSVIANIIIFIYGKHLNNQYTTTRTQIIEISTANDNLSYNNAEKKEIDNLINSLNTVINNLNNILKSTIVNIICSLLVTLITFIPIAIIGFIYKNTQEFPTFGYYEDWIIGIGLLLDVISCFSNIQESFSYISVYRQIFSEANTILISLGNLLNAIPFT